MKTSFTAVILFLTFPLVTSFLLPPPVTLHQPLSLTAKTPRVKPLPPTAPAPTLTSIPPMKIALLVEPTPFNYVCGYSNRYNEMLRYIKKAGDDVSILTTDDKPDPPK